MMKSEAVATSANSNLANGVPAGALLRSSVQIIDASMSDRARNAFSYRAPGSLPASHAVASGLHAGLAVGGHDTSRHDSGRVGTQGGFAMRMPAGADGTFGATGYAPTGDRVGDAIDEADAWSDTIVELPYEAANRPVAELDGAVSAASYDREVSRRTFRIRPADDHGHRTAASMLINKMYSQRGYETGFLQSNEQSNRITLIASDSTSGTLGTLSLGLDSQAGLLVDEMYRDEVDAVRAQGRTVCEFTKLAIDQQQGSKRVLGALFHITYIYARYINQCTDLFIEVNPRHAPFYRRMLGFRQGGEARVCPRVNAPAVLLRLELDYVDERIRALGGQAGLGVSERSLYPYFFSKHEEAGIARRLRTLG